MENKIEQIIYRNLKEINEKLKSDKLNNPNIDTHLYGANGLLDSMSLVILISDIEIAISEEFNKNITLANEKALSQKISPFRSVRSLVEYIEKLLAEAQ